ncbi:mucin-2-like [Pleurodeles waltl]|uniref:mucin-2-like n=1 Tax=Pleurodeles waltl TaxID=8319 RepID=UPI003709BF1A
MSRLLLLLLLGAARSSDTSKAQGPMGDGLDKLRGAVGPVKVISVPQRISKPRRTAPSLLPSANMHGGLMVTTPTHLPGKRLNKWVRKPLPSPPESSHTGMELSVKAAQKPHPGPPWRERTGSLPGALPQEYSEWSKIAPAQARAPKDIAKQLGRGPSAARKSPGWQGQMGRKGCNQQVCAGSTSIPRNPSTRPASFTHAPVSMATRSLRQEPDSSEKTHQSGPEWNVQHVRDGGVTDHASASRLEGANGRTGTDDLQFLTQAGPGRASKVRGLLEPQGLSRSAPSSLLASADSLPRSTDTREFVQPVGMATGASKSETLAQEKAKTTYSSRGLRLQKAELQATKLLNSRAVGGNAGVNARAQPLGLLQGASFTGGVEHNTLPMSKSFKASARPARTRLARLPVRNDGSRTPPFTPEPTSSCSSTGDVQDALSLEEPSGPYRCPTPTGISQEPFGNLLQLRKATFPESTMASDHGNPPSLEAKGLGGLSVLEPITPVDRPPPKQTSPTKQPPLEPSMLEIHSSSGMPEVNVLHQQNTQADHSQPELAPSNQLPLTVTMQANKSIPEPDTPAQQKPPVLNTTGGHIPSESNTLLNQIPPVFTTHTNYYLPELTTPAKQIPPALTTLPNHYVKKLPSVNHYTPKVAIHSNKLSPAENLQTNNSVQDTPMPAYDSPGIPTPANHAPIGLTTPANHHLLKLTMTAQQLLPVKSTKASYSIQGLTTPANYSKTEVTKSEKYSQTGQGTPTIYSSPEISNSSIQSLLVLPVSENHSRAELSLGNTNLPEPTTPEYHSFLKLTSLAGLSPLGQILSTAYSRQKLSTHEKEKTTELTTQTNSFLPELRIPEDQHPSAFNTLSKQQHSELSTQHIHGETTLEKQSFTNLTKHVAHHSEAITSVNHTVPNSVTSVISESSKKAPQTNWLPLNLTSPNSQEKTTNVHNSHPELATEKRDVLPENNLTSTQSQIKHTTFTSQSLQEQKGTAMQHLPEPSTPKYHILFKQTSPDDHFPAEVSTPVVHLSANKSTPVMHISPELVRPSGNSPRVLTTPAEYTLTKLTTLAGSTTSVLTPPNGHTTSRLTTHGGNTSELTTLTSHPTTKLMTLKGHAISELSTPRVNITSELPTTGRHTTSELTIQTGHTQSELVTLGGRIGSEVTTSEDNRTPRLSIQPDHSTSELTAQGGFTPSELPTPAGQNTSKLTRPTVYITSKLTTSRGDHTSKMTTPAGHTTSEVITLKGYTSLELTTQAGNITPELGTPTPSPTLPDLTTPAGHITPISALPGDNSTLELASPTHHGTPALNLTANSTTAELIAQAGRTVPKVTTSIFPSPSSLLYDSASNTHRSSTENETSFVTSERAYNGATQWRLPHQTFQTNGNPSVSVRVTETPEILTPKHNLSTGMEGGTQPPEDNTSWNASSTGPLVGTQIPNEPSSWHKSSPGIRGGPHVSEVPFSWQQSSPGPLRGHHESEEPKPWQESFPQHTRESGTTEKPNSWQEFSTRQGGSPRGQGGSTSWQYYSKGHMNGPSEQPSLSEEPNFWEESSSSPAQNTKLPDETSSEFTLTTNPTGDAEITKSHGLLLATSTGLIRATTPQEEPGTWYPPLAAGTGIPDSPTPEDPELLISTVTGRVTKPLRAEVSSSPRPSGRYLTMTTRSSISIRTTLDHQQSHATSAVTVHPTHKTSLSTSHHATSRGVSERSGRVFIVEDQPPILKAQELNVTFKLALETGFAETFDSVDSLQHQALVLSFEETVSPFYKSVPGFLWLEMLSIREGSVILEYAAIFNAESMNPLMMEHPEHLLNLSRLPDAISAGLWVAGHRVLGVSATDRGADLCAIAYTCLDGFTCAHNRNGNITCTSVCHDGFCKNEGICTHRRGQDPMCQCPVGSDYWFMGVRCDYRMTQQALLGISCGVILSLVLCISAIAYLAMRRFKALLVETKINQTKSSYRRFSRFDDISTRYWSHSQSQSWLGASISSLDNLAYSHSEEVLHLHALESRRGSSLEDADNAGTCSPRSTPHRRPECRPGFHSDWETSCSSFNDPMVDSGKASAISVSSWPMEPIQWTPFPILHQLSAQSPFRTRRPHSYCEGMELVNMERSWTA